MLQTIEVYYPEKYKDEAENLKGRLKNFHYMQIVNPEDFEIANKPQLIKLDNNKYFKKFNLIAN